MPKRIDLDGGDSHDELEEALRQLQRPKRTEARPREEVQEAVREIAEQQKAEAKARKERVARPPWLIWALIGSVVLIAVVLAVILLRPEPLPPPAATAQEAVSGFWRSLIDGKYEAATVYYPSMVDKYGSRKQAAEKLREHFGDNPPVRISKVGEPEQVPDSTDTRVSYEVYLRSGSPRGGDAIVSSEGGGYVIVAGI
jgi:Sec-independent protein translocase protein TatA